MFCDIIIPHAGKKAYTYKCNERVHVGDIVNIPFGKGTARGVVISKSVAKEVDFNIKEVESIAFPEFSLHGPRLDLFNFMVKHYAAFESEAILLFFPPGVLKRSKNECRAKKIEIPPTLTGKKLEIFSYLRTRYPRWIKKSTLTKEFGSNVSNIISELKTEGLITCRDVLKTAKPKPFIYHPEGIKHKEVSMLTEGQQKIYNDVLRDIKNHNFRNFLLFGVTGSGKTAIYYKLFEYVLENNKSGIFLVPEIALTVQSLTYFLNRYKERVFVYHSGLSNTEKNWIAKKCASSDSVVVIGTRSSLFLPISNLSLLVVDEEHDFSYKEEERMPMYDAREIAEFIGRRLNIPVLMGSGTPDVISFYKASIKNDHGIHIITERFKDYANPEIEIVDMKKERPGKALSLHLIDEIKRSLDKKKGIILFINRRGYTPFVQCMDCGKTIYCPMCSVPLVLHKREKVLKCHICGHTEPIPDACPYCGSHNLFFGGYGTERIEEEVKRFFPYATISILDRDTVQKKGMKEKIYRDFINKKIDILIGTQMISVGFDFPHVETVGIINADTGLMFPDYRAEERVAQTLFQVAGRLRKKGKVIVQTRDPEHPIFVYLKNHDYRAFLLYELDNRKRYQYPPFLYLIRIIARSKNAKVAREQIIKINEEIKNTHKDVIILGPAPPPYEKIRGEYRWQLVLKVKENDLDEITESLKSLREESDIRNMKITVNVNPYSML